MKPSNANYSRRQNGGDKRPRLDTGMMREKTPYEKDLRAIGQALERRALTVFEIKNQPGRYIVRGTPDKPSSVMDGLRRWIQKNETDPSGAIHYTPHEIDELERQGKKKRMAPGRLPDFYNLSNTLRTLGAYLSSQNAELLEIHKRPLTVTLLYQNQNGHPRMEDRTIASFFNVFLEMHGRRSRLPG
jgi:hypothetical protein